MLNIPLIQETYSSKCLPFNIKHLEYENLAYIENKSNGVFSIGTKNILMIDFDESFLISKEDWMVNASEYVNKNRNLRFLIHETKKGIHAFLISEYLEFGDKAEKIMRDLNSDDLYIEYSRFRGYFVRVTPKDKYDYISSPGYFHKGSLIKEIGYGNKNLDIIKYIDVVDELIVSPSNYKDIIEKLDLIPGKYKETFQYPGILYQLKDKLPTDIYLKLSKITRTYIINRKLEKKNIQKQLGENIYQDGDGMIYMLSSDVLMLDWDEKNGISKDLSFQILSLLLKKYPNFVFRILESDRGIHAYLVSQKMLAKDAIHIMSESLSDPIHSAFSLKYGYSTRLSKKEKDDYVAKDLGYYGKGNIDKEADDYVSSILALI